MERSQLQGRILDLDSHLMLLPSTLRDILGSVYRDNEVEQRMVHAGLEPSGDGTGLAESRRRARADVWNVKGWGAHGAQIASDRVDALDQMGVARQLLFPGGIGPAMHITGPEAEAAVARYNDYVLSWAKGTYGRVEPVCALNTTTLDAMEAEAGRIIDCGGRVVLMTCGIPPAGMSPAGAEWDDLWAMLATSGVGVALHPVATGGLRDVELVNRRWSAAGHKLGLPLDDSVDDMRTWPYTWMTAHLPAEMFLTFMVLGGVLERHPDLRVGVIEMGASWVASWCERMDRLALTTCAHLSGQLSFRPSEYVRRQVRVTPFVYEAVGSWFTTGGLQDVFVFSTDYPHSEGGTDPVGDFHASLSCLDDDMIERFFVTNGSVLLPS